MINEGGRVKLNPVKIMAKMLLFFGYFDIDFQSFDESGFPKVYVLFNNISRLDYNS